MTRKSHASKIPQCASGDVARPMYSAYADEVKKKYPNVDFSSSIFDAEMVPYYHRMKKFYLTEELLSDAKGAGIKISLTKFHPHEDELIRKNWDRVCQIFDLEREKPEIYLWLPSQLDQASASIFRSGNLKFFCANMLDRTARQVLDRAKRILPSSYGGSKCKKDFTPEDDALIRKHVDTFGMNKWGVLALKMGRERRALATRYSRISTEKAATSQTNSDLWVEENVNVLEKAVAECSECASAAEAAQCDSKRICWYRVAAIFKKETGVDIPPHRCQTKWVQRRRVYLGKDSPLTSYNARSQPEYQLHWSYESLLTIIQRLANKKKWSSEVDVDWRRVQKKFVKLSPYFSYKCCDTYNVRRLYFHDCKPKFLDVPSDDLNESLVRMLINLRRSRAERRGRASRLARRLGKINEKMIEHDVVASEENALKFLRSAALQSPSTTDGQSEESLCEKEIPIVELRSGECSVKIEN